MKKTPETALCGHILKKIQHIHFLLHGHFSWFMFVLGLVRGPKTLRMQFFGKSDHISVAMKCDHGKMPSNMGTTSPLCKQPPNWDLRLRLCPLNLNFH